jgi:hypothetical protein
MYKNAINRSAKPSFLDTIPLLDTMKYKIIVQINTNGWSINLDCFFICSGFIAAHKLIIKNKLAKLLPTTLPIEISERPFKADVTLTTNSGSEVPIATIVSPIISSEILSFLAILDEPSTRKSAPFC